MTQQINPRQLVRWLGADGARAGLMQSKRLTIDVLRRIAESLDVKLPEKTTRQQWIEEIVKVASRRIDKPIHELFEMDEAALLDYFEQIDVEPAEILDILKELDVSPRLEGRRGLMEFAARELSETGRFMRIAGTQQRRSDNQAIRDNGCKRDAANRDVPDSQADPGAGAIIKDERTN
jgi:hypothetical protein